MVVPASPAADVAVVGLGAAGSALLYHLARRGVRVVGLDRFDPPHDQGSSHGRTRITRLAIGEGAAYVPLVRRSHALWRELEAECGRTLLRATGVMLVGAPAAEAAAYHGQPGFFGRTLALARQHGIAHELLDPADVRARFPAFRLGDGERAYFEPEGGVLFPEDCVRSHLEAAERRGARVLRRCRLAGWESHAQGITLHTGHGPLHAAHAVLCTGAWLPGQAGGAVAARLRVLRQVLHWFRPERAEWFDPARCPAFMWLHGMHAEDAFYGFPCVDDVAGVKVATEQFSTPTDPDAVDRHVAPHEAQALFQRHLSQRLAGLRPETVQSATCLYTMAPDGRFVVDRHPQHLNVTLVSPCSGHGFKHSAGLGEALACQLTGAAPAVDLSPFRLPAADA